MSLSLSDHFKSMSKDCFILASDVNAMIHAKSKGDKQPASRKSLEPVTRLRKDSKELTEAEGRDPEEQFIVDKLNDIFG